MKFPSWIVCVFQDLELGACQQDWYTDLQDIAGFYQKAVTLLKIQYCFDDFLEMTLFLTECWLQPIYEPRFLIAIIPADYQVWLKSLSMVQADVKKARRCWSSSEKEGQNRLVSFYESTRL